MQKNTIIYLLFAFAFWGFSQEEKEHLTTVNGSNQLLENIHLRINKTSFASGEYVWFTAYIQNQKTLLPSAITENLNVGIYDDFGKEMYRKLLRVDNGIAYGDFEIDSTLKKGSYHIIAWTNYLRNFEKLEPFQQQIEILGNATDNEIKVTAKIELYTYPEGGALISGAFNYIGLHLKNNFNDHKPIIKLLDDNGEVLISSISISDEGFGKIGFFIKENENYFFEIQNSYGEISTVPLKNSLGLIGLSIDNTGGNQLLAKLVLSEESLSKNNNKAYSLAIVQEDSVYIQDWVVNKNQLALSINREAIPYGVNKAILFDERQRPIAYRMFFNHSDKSSRVTEINVRHQLNTSRDSLELSFSTLLAQSLKYNLSVSVLPLYTEANNPQNSLTSSFLIKPYVNGGSNYKYEFSDFNGFQNYDLDIKLMIEGWSKYDWGDSLIINDNIRFESEKGISVKGRMPDADLTEENQVLLITDVSKAINYEQLRSDKTFETHMALYENDSLAVTLIGKKGVLRKPKLEIQVDTTWKENNIDILKFLKKQTIQILEDFNEDKTLSLRHEVEVIELDEATVIDIAKRNNKLLLTPTLEASFIDDEDIKKTPSLVAYFRTLGLRPIYINGDMKFRFIKWPYPISFITINGMPVSPGELDALPLSRVQSLIVLDDRTEQKHAVAITLRSGFYVSPEKRDKYIKQFISNGYAKPNEYFNPGYEDYESIVFKKYGALYWKSNIPIT